MESAREEELEGQIHLVFAGQIQSQRRVQPDDRTLTRPLGKQQKNFQHILRSIVCDTTFLLLSLYEAIPYTDDMIPKETSPNELKAHDQICLVHLLHRQHFKQPTVK